MFTPYVQDVYKWVDHYKKNGKNIVALKANEETTNVTGITYGLAQKSDMSVSKVEPRGPPPPVPSTGAPIALRTVSTSQVRFSRLCLIPRELK